MSTVAVVEMFVVLPAALAMEAGTGVTVVAALEAAVVVVEAEALAAVLAVAPALERLREEAQAQARPVPVPVAAVVVATTVEVWMMTECISSVGCRMARTQAERLGSMECRMALYRMVLTGVDMVAAEIGREGHTLMTTKVCGWRSDDRCGRPPR